MQLIWFNGNWVAPEDARYPIANRGLKYGDGLFESFRVIGDQWVFKLAHQKRLMAGAEILRYKIPDNFFNQVDQAFQAIKDLMPAAHCSLRIFRAGAGKYTPDTDAIEWFIEARALADPYLPPPAIGIEVDYCESIQLAPHLLSKYKTANALPYVLASLEKKEKGLDDLILLGPAGNLVEGTSSNLFVLKNDRLLTPPLSQGALGGIMRSELIALARAKGDHFLFEQPIFESDVEQADELWLVNSSQGIRWVKKFKTLTFGGAQAKIWQANLNTEIRQSLGIK